MGDDTNTTDQGARPIASAGNPFKAERVLRPREQVEKQIKQAILSGKFENGDKLPSEGQLATQFSVSRATLREALRSLASMGLISKVPGASGGSFVRVVNHEALSESLLQSMDNTLRIGAIELHEIVTVRGLLEVPSVRLAANNRDERDLEAMRKILTRQREIDWSDPVVPVHDMNFHRAIAEATKNRVLTAFVTALHRAGQPVRFLELSPQVGQSTVRQHTEVYRAIEAGDPDAAEAAMKTHLEYVVEHSRDAKNEKRKD